MIYLMMLPTFFIMTLALYYTSRSGEKPNGNLLLGVTLPREKMKHLQVLAIVKSYHNANLRYLYLSFMAIIPTYFIRDYISLILLYLTVFCIWLFFVNQKLYVKYFRELYDFKRENSWFIGETHVISMDTEVSKADEDEFWVKGYYYNPDDSRTLVEKRIGIGMTTNMATPIGKLTNLLLAATVLFMVGLSLFFIPIDFGKIEMNILDGNIVQITAPQYSEQFKQEDIVSVKMLTSFPDAHKIHGIDSGKYFIGDFDVNEYKACKVYIYRKSDAFLLIELTNGYVFLNGSTQEETKLFYKELTT